MPTAFALDCALYSWMQLLHALLMAQQCLLLFCKASLQCCCFWHDCLMLLIRDAMNNLAPRALDNPLSHPPPDPRLNWL